MTELYIDGVAVVLPSAFSVAVKRENPFFTKNGEYTYDVALQLTNPVNANLYQHLNRLNSLAELPDKRSAILIADNRVYCNGTEIITGWTDEEVTIQIVSGNSQLNYFIGGDLLISRFDMGKAIIPAMTNMANIPKILEKVYPEVEYCLPPVMTESDSINGWRIVVGYKSNGATNFKWVPDVRSYFNPGLVNIYAQPYVLSYLSKLMNAIGYKIVNNQLEESEWQMTYLPQNGHPTEYAKMFPGWSVNEFVSELERLFNFSFIVDNKRKEVSIIFNSEYYKSAQVVHVREVIDEYEVEQSQEDADLSHSNIKIEAPTSEYYRFQHLDENLMASATRIDMDSLQKIVDHVKQNGYDNCKKFLFFDSTSERYYIADPNAIDPSTPVKEVNMFGDLNRDETTTDVTLKLIPADMMDYGLEPEPYDPHLVPFFGVDSDRTRTMIPNIPKIQSDESDEGGGIYERVVDNVSESNSGKSSLLYIAFYKGMKDLAVYPKVYNKDGNIETGPFGATIIKFPYSYNCDDSAEYSGNLRITYLNRMLYKNMYNINVDNGIKISSYDPNLYDPRSVFEIRNKRYVCKEMEFSLSASGRNGPWTGTFYPIDISDTETEQRWILTDGKWRDGGIYVDNGRWLDS